MRKTSIKQTDTVEEMRSEYDFSGGVRGKFHKAMQDGYTVHIHQADGTTIEKHVEVTDTVILDPDVREYFPNSQAVNNALRTLIALVPRKRLHRKALAR